MQIPNNIRNRHIYIAGSARHGKSTLIERIVTLDMIRGAGCCILDPKPQGPLATALLHRVPKERAAKAIYLDIADPVPIDFFSWNTETERQALAGELYQTFLSFVTMTAGDTWRSILRATIHTLLAAKDCCFIDINRILTSESAKDKILRRVFANNRDGIYTHLLEYWRDEFPELKKDAAQPVITRMKEFLFTPLAKLLGSPRAKLDIAKVIRDRQILIVNLGTLDKDAASLVGKLIVTKIQQTVFHQDPSNLIPHFLYADEFQNFQTSAFDVILSEAGGFKLCLTLANQGLYQLDDKIRDSVFANVTGARIAFHISHKDLPNWKHLAEPYYPVQQLADLPPHRAFYKIGTDVPVIKATKPPLPPHTAEQKKTALFIRGNTFDQYAVPRYAQNDLNRSVDNASSDTGTTAAQLGKDDNIRPTPGAVHIIPPHGDQTKGPRKPR